MSRRILIDMDGILADLLTPWIRTWNEESGDDLRLVNQTSWDIHECVKGKSLDIYKIIERPGFFRTLEPLAGAVAGVKDLMDAGNEVFIVSAAGTPHALKEKAHWLQEHLPFLNKRQIFFGHEKHLLTADVLIDDSPHNAKAYRKAHPNSKILTISYPYNANCEAYNLRAPNWTDPKYAWDWILGYLNPAPVEAVCTTPSGRTDCHMTYAHWVSTNVMVCAFCGETE